MAPEQAQAAFAQGANPKQGLGRMLADHFAAYRIDPDWPRLFLQFLTNSRSPEVGKRLALLHRRIHEMVRQLIQNMQHAGLLASDLDPSALALLYRGILEGMVLIWLIDPRGLDLKTVAPAVARILSRGIQPRRRRAAD